MSDTSQDRGALPREVAIRFLPIIRRAAQRLARRLPPHVCIDDLKGAGFVGLVEAHRRHDPALGQNFDAYADTRIRGAMLDELRARDPLSRDLRAHAGRVTQATRALEGRLGRAPVATEIAAELGMELGAYLDMNTRGAIGAAVSIDARSDEGGLYLELRDTAAVAADEAMMHGQVRRDVNTARDALPPRLRQILEMYYGDELTLRDIGGILGVTESRVCQLHAEALKQLRATCAVAPEGRRGARVGGGNAARRVGGRSAGRVGVAA